jgi:sulfoxide reductase heme-binding subunit YedZ
MIGVGALAYVALHFSLYMLDQRFNMLRIALEIVLRFYLTLGFVALLGLAALGATSTDAMIKKLGVLRWNRLHKLVYPIVALGLVHDLLQARTEITEACVLAGIAAYLCGERMLRKRGAKAASAAYAYGLAALAVVGGIATFGLEAAWLGIRNHIDPWRVLAANFDFTYEIRPGWFVLAAGLALAAVAIARNWKASGALTRTSSSALRQREGAR